MQNKVIAFGETSAEKRLWQYVALIMMFLALMICVTSKVFSSDVFDVATTASSDLIGKFSNLANAVFPLALIVCGVCMLFTHDQRKFELEKSILIGIFLAYVLILLAQNGTILRTIQNISGLSGNISNPSDTL